MNYSKIFPIREYYRKYVIPINPGRYRESATTMVCPVHNDHDPSLGVISNKTGELCHCFGCNFWGDVVELHRRVNRHHFKKYLSEEEAKIELCGIFGVDYNSLPQESEDVHDRYFRQELALDESVNKFDIGDFKQKLLEGKIKKKGIAYFNTVLMVMVGEVKSLEG